MNNYFIELIFYNLLIVHCCPKEITLEEQFLKLSRQKRYFTIPSGSAIGLILAFAVPVPDLPEQDLLFSWNFEANYNLPDELYYFGTSPTIPDLNQDVDLEDPVKRSLRYVTRTNTFEMLERRLESFGLHGQTCLLKLICEINQSNIEHNGLLGQLIHILFTPTLNKLEEVPAIYLDAETKGSKGEDCIKIFPDCAYSVLDSFTI